MVELDPVTLAAARLVVDRDRLLDDLPVAVPVTGVVSVVGRPGETRNVVRALVAQLAVLHAPDDVRLAWLLGGTAGPEFDWVKWLPHCLDPGAFDGPAPRRLVAADPAGLAGLLAEELGRRMAEVNRARRLGDPNHRFRGSRLVLVTDQVSAGPVDPLGHLDPDLSPADLGIATVVLVTDRQYEPSRVDVRVTCADGRVTVEDLRPLPDSRADKVRAHRDRLRGAAAGTADRVSLAEIEALARQVSPLRLVAESVEDAPLEATVDLRGCSASATRPATTCAPSGLPGCCRTSSRCPSGSDRRATRCTWISRRRRWAGWGRTGSASGPPDPASPRCCGHWCSRWRRPTLRSG